MRASLHIFHSPLTDLWPCFSEYADPEALFVVGRAPEENTGGREKVRGRKSEFMKYDSWCHLLLTSDAHAVSEGFLDSRDVACQPAACMD
ncbi:hypothetical protein SRHO_G00094830 [Serrasalmus rhombeus]